MSETITNDLLRYLYNETTPEEHAAISAQLEADAGLQRELQELAEAIAGLSELELDASPTSINIILEHAQKQEVHH